MCTSQCAINIYPSIILGIACELMIYIMGEIYKNARHSLIIITYRLTCKISTRTKSWPLHAYV